MSRQFPQDELVKLANDLRQWRSRFTEITRNFARNRNRRQDNKSFSVYATEKVDAQYVFSKDMINKWSKRCDHDANLIDAWDGIKSWDADIYEETKKWFNDHKVHFELIQKLYEDYIKSPVKVNLQEPKENEVKSQWQIYFHEVITSGFPKSGIVRGVLKIYEDGHAQLSGYTDGASSSYSGRWRTLPGNRVSILSFPEEENQYRHIHVKVYSDLLTEDLAIGVFLTYEQHHGIICSSIVLVPEDETLEPDFLSIESGISKFQTIPIQIREFLSQQLFNHAKLPFGIFHLAHLERLTNKMRLTRVSFFETEKVKVFISSPVGKIGVRLLKQRNKQITATKQALEHDTLFTNKGGEAIGVEVFCQIEPDENLFREKVQFTIENISKCSLFVLYYYASVPSFSLLELGIALSHSKRILIFYRNRNDLPKKIKELEKLNFPISIYAFSEIKDNPPISRIIREIKDLI